MAFPIDYHTYFTVDIPSGSPYMGGATATVSDDGSGTGPIRLSWHDGFINEWHEDYPTLALALARLAVLAHCGEDDWRTSFATGPDLFAERASQFLDEVTS